MDKIVSKKELKRNFLELCSSLSNEESKTLVNLENTESIENMIAHFCTLEFPIQKVLLYYHRYAGIAFVSAEFMKNAKIFINDVKSKYILIALKQKDSDSVSIVYSNVDALSKYPSRAISIKEIISFLEESDVEAALLEFFKRRKTFL